MLLCFELWCIGALGALRTLEGSSPAIVHMDPSQPCKHLSILTAAHAVAHTAK